MEWFFRLSMTFGKSTVSHLTTLTAGHPSGRCILPRLAAVQQIGGRSGQKLDNIKMSGFENFKPQEGFGGNPVDNGNWWMLTQGQMEQAIKYGVLREFNRDENIFADYDSVWKGYKRHEGNPC